MPIPVLRRSARASRLPVGGAFLVGTLVLACTLGTAHAANAAPPSVAPQATTPSAVVITYTVKLGDTLAAISRSHRVPGGWQAIASANRLSNPHLIALGQVLTLPAGSSAPGSLSGDQSYTDNLDGWIRSSLAIMAQHGIPGTYNGIYRNVMRESSGKSRAINLWDSNAAKGTPSKGLLQVIQPTFNAYHVPGTSWDIYDPVANITAACNYAYHRYGSIDNVNGPY